MAYTKVIAIRSNLAQAVNYVANTEKTVGLGSAIEYAANPDKTEQRCFESVMNCQSPATAYEEMRATKHLYEKTGGVLGYHFIQSFAPGDVTPEQAHAIGREFAGLCFKEDYEVVIGTHLDRDHLHNHIIINSVALDGSKYHSSPKSYYNNIRGASDALCREHGLSVIEPGAGVSKHYTEWQAEQSGKATIRQMIAADIDAIIRRSYTFQSFIQELRNSGYSVKYGVNVKHMTVRPQGGKRNIRLHTLGPEYSEAAIKERLARIRSEEPAAALPQPPAEPVQPRRYHSTRPLSRTPRRKLRGFTALYFHYLYLLGKVKKRRLPNRAVSALREDVIQFNQYQRQFLYLHHHGIHTGDQLVQHMQELSAEMERLVELRKPLYSQRNHADDESIAAELSQHIGDATAKLRSLRSDRYLCERIRLSLPDIQLKVEQVADREAQTQRQRNEREKGEGAIGIR